MKYDLEKLKEKNPLASVIQEITDCKIFSDDPDGRYLKCEELPELRIDPEAGRWYQGEKRGDVINWLMEYFAWSFIKSAEYLENRAKRPEIERNKLDLLAEKPQVKNKDVQPSVLVDNAREWPLGHEGERGWSSPYPGTWVYDDPLGHITDARLQKALPLLDGFPRSVIDNLVLFGLSGRAGLATAQYGLLTGIPTNFVQAIGWLFVCGGCYVEFDDFVEYYYPVLSKNKIELVEFDDTYCPDCVKKYMRWHKGRVLLVAYLADNYPKDCWL
jgi:hypothetical protein